jgi:diguanylate cyclase
MRLALRLTAACIASLTGVAAILLILWPGWVSAATHQSYLLSAITLLLAITLVAVALGVIRPEPTAGSQPAPAGGEVSGEMAKIIALLRAHLEANGVYETVLAKANAQLPSLVNPEQVRMIVSYLMVENDTIRTHTRELQTSLEQSRRQIENLKSNLNVAKAEGMHDSLTSLRNRRGFDLTLASEIADARMGSCPLSLILADIDRFKAVNDSLGHPAGDDVLRWFAKILAANMKGRDTVARFGGEEFAIILPRTRIENAASLAGQIRAQVEQTLWRMPGTQETSLKLTASFGVAELSEGENSGTLVKRADAKLYEAKSQGRNRVAR